MVVTVTKGGAGAEPTTVVMVTIGGEGLTVTTGEGYTVEVLMATVRVGSSRVLVRGEASMSCIS
jgi:hypothetical protein